MTWRTERRPWLTGSFLDRIPEAARDELLRLGSPVTFPGRHVLVREGDPGSAVYLLLDALVKVTALAENGSRTLLSIRAAGVSTSRGRRPTSAWPASWSTWPSGTEDPTVRASTSVCPSPRPNWGNWSGSGNARSSERRPQQGGGEHERRPRQCPPHPAVLVALSSPSLPASSQASRSCRARVLSRAGVLSPREERRGRSGTGSPGRRRPAASPAAAASPRARPGRAPRAPARRRGS